MLILRIGAAHLVKMQKCSNWALIYDMIRDNVRVFGLQIPCNCERDSVKLTRLTSTNCCLISVSTSETDLQTPYN